jgi:hypothetical protein
LLPPIEDKPKDSRAIKPADFQAQMQALKDSGITVIAMEGWGTTPKTTATEAR